MFTGIVTHRGRIEGVEPTGTDGILRLRVLAEPALTGLVVGDSVAVDGCCLTVTSLASGRLVFDAIPETLRKTTLGGLAVGDVVNLEGALRMSDALGGHLVQGHVDGVGIVRGVQTRGEDVRLSVGLPAELAGDVLPKGSVTIDGVSLTVGEVWTEGDEEQFSVYLIPHTLAVTGLGNRAPGAQVNLEADVLGRWVRHHLERMRGA